MSAQQRLPELDSLRGLAASAVFIWHATREIPSPEGLIAHNVRVVMGFDGHGGRLGIVFFFLLSGYLITIRMLRERREGRFRLGRFMARRALRIWPLYYVVLILGFVAIPLLTRMIGDPVSESAPWWMHALFLANFSMLHHGNPDIGTLRVQWSVAVEEQFYLLWGLLLPLVRTERLFVGCISVLLIGSIAFAGYSDSLSKYFHLISNLRFLAAGSLLGALMVWQGEVIMNRINRISPSLRGAFVKLLPLAVLLLCLWMHGSPLRMAFANTVIVIAFCALLIERSAARDGVFRLDNWRLLPWLGERSYGLYLLHMPAIALARWITGRDEQLALVTLLLAALLSCLFAHIAYRLVEQPFLRLKDRLA